MAMSCFRRQPCPQTKESGSPHRRIFRTTCILSHDMTVAHSNKIVHGDQARWGKLLEEPPHLLSLVKNLVTLMLACDRFVSVSLLFLHFWHVYCSIESKLLLMAVSWYHIASALRRSAGSARTWPIDSSASGMMECIQRTSSSSSGCLWASTSDRCCSYCALPILRPARVRGTSYRQSHICLVQSADTFIRRHLKTFLFNQAFLS